MIVPQFEGELWTVSLHAAQEFGAYWIRGQKGAGFTELRDTINTGGNSGYQAIHLAATFGASRIVLLGYDMQRTGDRSHWHGDHIGGLPNGKGFPGWIKSMKLLARDLGGRGIEVVNCTRTTALDCFPKCSLRDAL